MKYFILFVFFLISIEIHAQLNDFKNINFTKADSIAKLYNGENLKNLPMLTYNLTINLETDVEKFRAIYSWICMNIKADYYMYKRINSARKRHKKDSIAYAIWNKNYSKKVFKRLLNNKKTMCTGYAYLLKVMTNLINIECKIVNGYVRNSSSNVLTLENPNHSWNAVKINNKWYLADATLSSGYLDLNNNAFVFDYNDGYFLQNPLIYSKTHYPFKKKWFLIDNNSKSKNNFTENPIVYGGAFKYGIYPTKSLKLNNDVSKNYSCFINFHTSKTINPKKLKLKVNEGNEVLNLKLDIQNSSQIAIEHQFKKTGKFDIHLYYNNEIITSSTFNVLE